VAFSNSASPEIIWGLGGPEEDHRLHHCCWTGHVNEREEDLKKQRSIPLACTQLFNTSIKTELTKISANIYKTFYN